MARFFVLALAILALATPAGAQTPPREPTLRDLPFELSPRAPQRERAPEARKSQEKPVEATKKTEAPQPTTLASLYERLAKAKDSQEASALVKQIERRWMRSGSETADLLMSRASQAMTVKESDTALELFDYIIMMRPDWAEAYHRRATLLFVMNDYDGALRDIQATLLREPRHFAAMSGLGMIMQQINNKKAAFAAFSKALELNPNFDNLKQIVERLRPEVEGRPL